jgi:hypothetical protein
MAFHPTRNLGFFGIVAFGSLLLFGAAGCKGNPVGRMCFLVNPELDGGVPQTIVGTPALECESSICLHVAGQATNMCSAKCTSDSDCEASPESPCKGGFTCAVQVVTGDFCCERLCVCRDQVPIPDGGGTIADPAACDPANKANECCNLTGRRGDPDYPLCK